jgi:hypothetical protein
LLEPVLASEARPANASLRTFELADLALSLAQRELLDRRQTSLLTGRPRASRSLG